MTFVPTRAICMTCERVWPTRCTAMLAVPQVTYVMEDHPSKDNPLVACRGSGSSVVESIKSIGKK